MKYSMVPVKNVSRLEEAGEALIQRGFGMPGMGVIWGETGAGKTTAVTWFANRCNAVYVRAMATWSPASMLNSILRELDQLPRRQSCAPMVEQIVEALAMSNRPLFIDEADYVINQKRMTETLRDLHDMASVPVVLVGMEGIQKRIIHAQQVSGRIAQWVKFQPCDLADTEKLAKGLCEVGIATDLLASLHEAAKGQIRLMVVGLSKIEQRAKARGLEVISLCDWKRGESFFLGKNQVQ